MKKLLVIFAASFISTFGTSAMAAPASSSNESKIFNFTHFTAVQKGKPVSQFPQTIEKGANAPYVLPDKTSLPVTVAYYLNVSKKAQVDSSPGCSFRFESDPNNNRWPPYGYKITAQGVNGYSDSKCQNDTGVLTIN